MEALLNQVLQAESTEQLGVSNYERSQERVLIIEMELGQEH